MKANRFAILMVLAAGAARVLAATPEQALEGMEKTWNSTESYSCRMRVVSHRDGKTLQQDFRFEFRKPRLARLKVLSGPDRGADVVYNRSGKVRAAKRILGIRVRKSMKADDPKFYDLRGVPFWKADLGSQIVAIHRTLSLPGASGTVTPGSFSGSPTETLTVRYNGSAPGENGRRHAYVDAWDLDLQTRFPIHRILTEDGRTVEEVTVTRINLSASLPESHFGL